MMNIKSIIGALKCNRCWINTKMSPQIFLFECGHIICQKCENTRVQREFCPVCKKASKMMELPKQKMHPIMEMMFWPFKNVVSQTITVMNFQTAQCATSLRGKEETYKSSKQYVVSTRYEHKALFEEVRTLREKLIAKGYRVPQVYDYVDRKNVPNASFKSAASHCGSTPGTARRVDPQDVSIGHSRTGTIGSRNITNTATKGSSTSKSHSHSTKSQSHSSSPPSMTSNTIGHLTKYPKPLLCKTSTPMVDSATLTQRHHVLRRTYPRQNPTTQTPRSSNFGGLSEISPS